MTKVGTSSIVVSNVATLVDGASLLTLGHTLHACNEETVGPTACGLLLDGDKLNGGESSGVGGKVGWLEISPYDGATGLVAERFAIGIGYSGGSFNTGFLILIKSNEVVLALGYEPGEEEEERRGIVSERREGRARRERGGLRGGGIFACV